MAVPMFGSCFTSVYCWGSSEIMSTAPEVMALTAWGPVPTSTKSTPPRG